MTPFFQHTKHTGAQQTWLMVLLRRKRWDNISVVHCACLGFVGISLEFDFWVIHPPGIPEGCLAPQVNNSCGAGWVVATLLCIYQEDDLNLHLLCSWGSIFQATKFTSAFFTLHLFWAMKYSLIQRAQGQGRQLDNSVPKIRFHSPHLNQRVQKLINSPNGTLLITLSQSASFCSLRF